MAAMGRGPNRRVRKLLWAALAAAVAALAAAGAPKAVSQVYAGVRAELALHRTVAVHETRIGLIEGQLAADAAARQKASARVDRLIELLEAEERARAPRAPKARR